MFREGGGKGLNAFFARGLADEGGITWHVLFFDFFAEQIVKLHEGRSTHVR